MFEFIETDDPPTDSKIISCHIPGTMSGYTQKTISNSLLYKDYEKEAIAYVKRQLARELTDRILDKQFEAEEKKKEEYNSVGYNEYLLYSSDLEKWYKKWSKKNDFVFSIDSAYANPAEEFKLNKNSYHASYHAGGVVGPVLNQENEVVKELTKYFGDCLKDVVKYPCNCNTKSEESSALKTVIIHLNDHCQWTREKIADWLETLDIDITLKEE